MTDWGGKIAAWFAGVAAASAGLAALVAQAAKEPLHGGTRDLFTALVVIAALSFLALLLTGPRAAWVTWRNRENVGIPQQAKLKRNDWIAKCSDDGDHRHHQLTFMLMHRFTPAAVVAFLKFRCTVTDPAGVTSTAVGTYLFYDYEPAYFPGAPSVRSGIYRFTWEGMDQKAVWREIAHSTYEVDLPATAR